VPVKKVSLSSHGCEGTIHRIHFFMAHLVGKLWWHQKIIMSSNDLLYWFSLTAESTS